MVYALKGFTTSMRRQYNIHRNKKNLQFKTAYEMYQVIYRHKMSATRILRRETHHSRLE